MSTHKRESAQQKTPLKGGGDQSLLLGQALTIQITGQLPVL